MKSIVVPTLLAAVVAAVVSIAVGRSGYGAPATSNTVTDADPATRGPRLATLLLAYKKNPDTTTILLSKESGACKAEVGSDPVGNRPEKRVFWHVLNDSDYPCALKETHPKIKLVFEPNGDGQYPFSNKEVNSRRHGDLTYVYEKIKKHGKHESQEVEYGLFKYAVYLTNGDGVDPTKPILDPDLEVEEPPNPLDTKGASGTAPPPKKGQ
jgi:hypothetical protein